MKDYDTFALMVDCSRNGVMNVPSVKRMIVLLEKMGYTALMLYTEDTFEVKEEPLFGYGRGRFTIEDLKEISRFGKEHHIELIPCVETLAHLNAIFTHPAYEEIHDVADILLAGEEKTYEFLDHLFDSLEEGFLSRTVNLGMDEAAMLGLGKYLQKHGYTNPDEIFIAHLKKVAEIARKHGFKPIFWGDMPFNYAQRPDGSFDFEKLAPFAEAGVTPCYWDYYSLTKKRYDERLEAYLRMDPNVWFAGGVWTWGGFAPLNRLGEIVTLPAMQSVREHKIRNVIMTAWGDNGAECSPFAALSTIFYAAMVAQGIEDKEEIKRRFKEIVGYEYDDFFNLGSPNLLTGYPWELEHSVLSMYDPSKYLLYNDPLNGRFDGAVNEEDDALFAKKAEELEQSASRMGEYGYLAHDLAALCSLLSIKNSLGVKTRELYKHGDKEAMKAFLPTYDECERRLLSFLEAFRARWFKDNHPQGFDIEEHRLGGLYFRLEEAKRQLSDWIMGKISSVPELEEEPLPSPSESFVGKDGKKHHRVFFWNNYESNSSFGVR